MSDLDWINKTLTEISSSKEVSPYKALFQSTIDNNENIPAKYTLLALFYNLTASKAHSKNLEQALENIYCQHSNLDAYLDKIVHYNPILGYISISASHRADMHLDCSLSIDVPTKSYEVDFHIKKIKEVLKMILVETKSIVE